ncbi:hypothetical protein [Butyricicoccus pullicaecorum]|uniref:hypothetical protein n=1 Tax=Butyricicoccus pullicaecorum TaxID=501571 RepID=UPI00399077C9
MGNENFIRFPGTKYEALALLYVKSRELSEMSPEQILDAYEDAYKKIMARRKERRSEAFDEE